MEALIRDLLLYARAASAPGDSMTAVNLNAIVDSALAGLRTTIEENEAEITAGPLPALAVEPIRFQQLFQNLIGNALKYRKDGEAPRIRVWAEQFDRSWIFSVSDNGAGIEPEYHSTVFGMFKRLHDQNRAGTGLGLAICQRIVEHYGGRIWVESEFGIGSTFRFSLPLHLTAEECSESDHLPDLTAQ